MKRWRFLARVSVCLTLPALVASPARAWIFAADGTGTPAMEQSSWDAAYSVALEDFTVLTAGSGNGDGVTYPRQHGAELELFNPATRERATFVLPAAQWRGLGRIPGARGFAYLDARAMNGPCAKVVVVPGGALEVHRKLAGAAGVPFSLDETAQGTLNATLKLGTGFSYCLSSAGGKLLRDVAMTPGAPGTFHVKNAPAPASCP